MKKWKMRLLICCTGLLSFLAGSVFSLRGAQSRAENVSADEANADREPWKVAITFDDGPHSVCTPLLLDGLKERGVRASFFLLGQCVRGNEEIVKRMREEGHLIGNHTFSHRDLTALGEEEAESEVIRTGNAIYGAAGVYPSLVRPPFGRWPDRLEFRVTMIPVLWTLDSRDWALKDAQAVADEVLDRAEPGDIILMHDCYETSVEAALRVIDGLSARGYEFVTVDDLIFS